MTLTVLFFAAIREVAGTDSMRIELGEGANLADLVLHLSQISPQLEVSLKKVSFAVNHDYASFSTVLREGDEVAVIPPVGGG